MDLFDAIRTRHSFRAFKSTPVAREDLERIIGAGRLAPSSLNAQPWGFHIATGDTRRRVDDVMERTTVYLDEYLASLGQEDRLEAATRFLGKLGGAPVVIAVSAPHVVDEMAQVNTLLSIGTAIENLLLAVTALRLGAVNVTFSYWVRDELAEVFGIGDDRYIVSVIAVGHPDEGAAAPAHDADVVFWYE
jgi:nitroreductase